MGDKNLLTVTVSRINEGMHQPDSFTMDAHTVHVTPDGTLDIRGESRGKTLQASLWESVEVKRVLSTSNVRGNDAHRT